MLPRTLEPEVMESSEEARDYDAMDHRAVNESFAADFLAAWQKHRPAGGPPSQDEPLSVLDCGTGTAQIPIMLARRGMPLRITAIDLSQEMLEIARRNVDEARRGEWIELRNADCKRLSLGDATFDAVMSNSIVHHLAEPLAAIREMLRVLRPGGLLFIRDLLRPDSMSELDSLVSKHTVGATQRQRQLFRDSLHAALTLDEIRQAVESLGLSPKDCERSSDRHWTVASSVGRKA